MAQIRLIVVFEKNAKIICITIFLFIVVNTKYAKYVNTGTKHAGTKPKSLSKSYMIHFSTCSITGICK